MPRRKKKSRASTSAPSGRASKRARAAPTTPTVSTAKATSTSATPSFGGWAETGYTVLRTPLAVAAGVPFAGGTAFSRCMYVKRHRSNNASADDGEAPASAALFVANLPQELNQRDTDGFLRQLFPQSSQSGSFVCTQIKGTSSTGTLRCVVVPFADAEALEEALAAAAEGQASVAAVAEPDSVGLEKWLRRCKAQCPDQDELQAMVDARVLAFEQEEVRVEAEKERRRTEMDADGFVMVSRKKTSGERRNNDEALARAMNKKKKGELKNFYRFQQREAKRDQLSKLREQFDQDKKRVAKMKSSRRFRPHG